MRVSHLMLVTLRDDPAEAEIISHKLLIRSGYIRRISMGIYAYMPLLWRVIKKISSCIREEMTSIGILETLLPQLQPADIWQRSNRWDGYTQAEGIMFHLEDRQGRELALGPTHEEVITVLVSESLRSYRQLPIKLYQIQTKFRDEIRPRFGLMRSREFIMKDAYSFHVTEEDLKSTYQSVDLAYKRIFKRCGLSVVPVDADSGAIGGAASQEFMVTAEAGEDLILVSNDQKYSANKERAVSLPKILSSSETQVCKFLFTDDEQVSITENSVFNEINSSNMIKIIPMLASFTCHPPRPILITIRADQQVNKVKLRNAVSSHISKETTSTLLDIIPIRPVQIQDQGLAPFPFGFINFCIKDEILADAKEWRRSFLRLIDPTASAIMVLDSASNSMLTTTTINFELFGSQADLRDAQEYDQCIHNLSNRLSIKRGIEVGHIFQLGRKYSIALNANFTNQEGIQEPTWMGCYGIGISRLSQAAVEQHHDEKGICWPISIAPFETIIMVANMRDEDQKNLGEAIYIILKNAKIDVLFDERQERAGIKFKDADLIGIPWQIIVGRNASQEKVELVERLTGRREELNVVDMVKYLLQTLENTHIGLLNN